MTEILGSVQPGVSIDAAVAAKVGAGSGGSNPFGLTEDQYSNQSLRLALIAQSSQVWEHVSGGADDYAGPSAAGLVNGDSIFRWMDAGPDQHFVYDEENFASASPTWNTGSGNGVDFDGAGNRLVVLGSKQQFKFLHDDSISFTLMMRVFFDDNITTATTPQCLLSTQTTTALGCLLSTAASGGATDLTFGVMNSGTFTSVDYTTWSGFAINTWYTIAVQHTQGGTTSIFIDDFSSAVATDTITSWSTGPSDTDLTLARRGTGSQWFDGRQSGLIVSAEALTQSEMEAWDSTIQTLSGT